MAKENKEEPRSVSVAEPYELPDGWKWTRLGDVAKFIGGGTPDKRKAEFWNGNIPWASVKDIKGDFLFSTEDSITEIGLNESSSTLCEENGLILVTRIAPGKAIVSKIKTAINQDLKIVQTNESKQFMKLFFDFYEEEIKRLSSGTTVKGIRLDSLQEIPFPLPPLSEQKRIVSRIESMFAKLDEATEKAESALESFETRKASILHKAFTGELTAKWRKENGVKDESWEEKTIGECFTHTTGKALKKDNQNGTPREYITTSNLYWDRFDFSEVRTMYFTDEELEKCTAKKGDLLICNGGDVGRAAIWNFDYEICLQNHVSKLRNKGNVETRLFLYYFMLSKIKGNVNGKGIGISSLSAKDLLAMQIKLPTLPEQQEIVRILDSVLEKESRAKETAQTVLDQIALLKKSILARAFRGEL